MKLDRDNTVTHPLAICNDEDATLHVPQMAFGELVKLAAPVIEHFHSDLYHDAICLSRIPWPLHKPFGFHYNVRSTGTTIVYPEGWTENLYRIMGGTWYYIEISREPGAFQSKWNMSVTPWEPLEVKS
jgi:hypothetical protein